MRGAGFFHQHVVAVENGLVLHRISPHFEDEYFLGAHEIRQRDGLITLHGFDRLPGRDAPHQRKHDRRVHAHGLLEPALGRQQVNRTAAVVVARQQSFFLQVRDVLVYGRQRRQLQSFANLLKRRRVLMLRHESRNEVVYFPLSACDCHGAIIGE